MDNHRTQPPRRYRSSTSTSSPPSSQVRTSALGTLVQRLSNLQDVTPENLRSTHDDLIRLSIFFDNNGQNDVQDQFRQIRGFQAAIHVIEVTLRNAEAQEDPADIQTGGSLIQIAIDVLGIITKAVHRHHGNSRFFAKRVAGGGWTALRRIFQQLCRRIMDSSLEARCYNDLLRISGSLIALATCDITRLGVFNSLMIDSLDDLGKPNNSDTIRQSGNIFNQASADESQELTETSVAEDLPTLVHGCFSSFERIVNLEAVTIVSDLFSQITPYKANKRGMAALSDILLTTFDCLIGMSESNRIAAHDAGVLSALLPVLTQTSTDADESAILRKLCASLLSLGTRTSTSRWHTSQVSMDSDSSLWQKR